MDRRWSAIVWDRVFAVTLALLLLYRPPVGIMRQGFDISLYLGGMLFLAALLTKVNIWSSLFMLWALISSVLSALLYSDPTVETVLITKQSISALWTIMCGSVIYATIVINKLNEKWILNALCVVSIIHVLCQMSQYFRGVSGIGIMFNPNDSSGFIALTFTAFLRPRWAYLLPIPVAGLILSKSFGGIVGVALVIVVYGWIHGYHFIPVALALVGSIIYGVKVDGPGMNRTQAWDLIIQWSFSNHWVIGCGPGNWKIFFHKLYDIGYIDSMNWVRVHNIWLEGFVEMGVIFPLLIIGYVVDNIRRFCNDIVINKEAILPMVSLGAIFGIGIGSSFFQFNQLNGIVAIYWVALLEVKLSNNIAKTKEVCHVGRKSKPVQLET